MSKAPVAANANNMNQTKTLKAISSITDTGLFERLGTAILREAEPQYKPLVHPGVNIEGKTIKGPVDNIAFVPNANPPQMITVHHTIGNRNGLRKKWLHDPSTVKQRKNNSKKAPLGDVLKTIGIYIEERKRTPNLRGTLVLTSSCDPTEDLVRDVEAIARDANIAIDFWPASRLVNFLDTNPTGQYLRKQFLGIEQERLSKELLAELSKKSLSLHAPSDNPMAWIDRNLDMALSEVFRTGVIIVTAESGLGKSIACYKRLLHHIDSGGYGIVLPHNLVANSQSLEQALDSVLSELYPPLMRGAGSEALALCSILEPLLIVVEDINKSGQAATLLEKIISWDKKKDEKIPDKAWQLLCPVWPQVLHTIDEEVRKFVNLQVLNCTSFLTKEGAEAVQCRYNILGKQITELEASAIASSLGNDPLLIALHDPAEKPDSNKAIFKFIDRKLNFISNQPNHFTASEYKDSLLILASEILKHRNFEPTWDVIQNQFKLSSEILSRIRHIAHQADILKLSGNSNLEVLVFRHDRVREWLLVEAMAIWLYSNAIEESQLKEPYYAELIGKALIHKNISKETIELIKNYNPLALFYALKTFNEYQSESYNNILSTIKDWLMQEKNHSFSNANLLWEAQYVLSETDSPHVTVLTELFKERTWWSRRASFRNGNIGAGIELCMQRGLGVDDSSHDQLIAYVIKKYGDAFVAALKKFLDNETMTASVCAGTLRLAGYTSNATLADSIKKRWEIDENRLDNLEGYLWSAAHCYGINSDALLDQICSEWASFSDEPEHMGGLSKKEKVVEPEIRFAFRKKPPINAIHYFIEQAKNPELHWEVVNMLREIDHPDAVEFFARELADTEISLEGTGRISPLLISAGGCWGRKQNGYGRTMSQNSRNRLQQLWENKTLSKQLRKQAFRLWSATENRDDVKYISLIGETDDLADLALWQRLVLGDASAISALITKLKDNNAEYWWQCGRYIWSDELTDALDNELCRRNLAVASSRNESNQFSSDWILSELIMRLPIAIAEKLLHKHWNHLCFNREFFQAALYIATPLLQDLVAQTIAESPNPKELFKHFSMHSGIRVSNHPGITRKDQIQALVPYLNLLDKVSIHALWELCNEMRWFELRKKYLDAVLSPEYRNAEFINENETFLALNKMLSPDRSFWVDRWLDEFLKTGVSVDYVIKLLFKWLRSQEKIEPKMLTLAFNAILHIGNRSYFADLINNCIESPGQFSEQIENAQFLMMRRSLN